MSSHYSRPEDPHKDGGEFLAAIGVPDADDWIVTDSDQVVSARRWLVNATACQVFRHRTGGLCSLVTDRPGKQGRSVDAPRPDLLLGPYLKAVRDDEAEGQR